MGNLCQKTNQSKSKEAKNNQPCDIEIKSLTWTRQSHGLFDYQSQNNLKSNLKLQNNGYIVRQNDSLKILNTNDIDQLNVNTQLLFEFHLNEQGNTELNFVDPTPKNDEQKKDYNPEDNFWAIVRSFKQFKGQRGYRLQKGDFIKLGRMRIYVKDMKCSNLKVSTSKSMESKIVDDTKTLLKNSQDTKISQDIKISQEIPIYKSQEIDVLKGKKKRSSKSPIIGDCCRICLCDDNENDNPLISPCLCSGTMKFLHLDCMRKWIKSKLVFKQSTNTLSISWKNFECELCKNSFPNHIYHNSQKLESIEYEVPQDNYIILEMLGRDSNNRKGLHVLDFNNCLSSKIGRGQECDVRITDISVSRFHANIKYINGSFYIEDNNSKFGSLALVNKKLEIKAEMNNLAFQIGRSVLVMNIKQKKNQDFQFLERVGSTLDFIHSEQMFQDSQSFEDSESNIQERDQNNIINLDDTQFLNLDDSDSEMQHSQYIEDDSNNIQIQHQLIQPSTSNEENRQIEFDRKETQFPLDYQNN